jgi:peptide/nickel transport system ATP-binding protein
MSAVPYPDPDRPLDFAAIGAGRQSVPEAWPGPFAPRDGVDPPMVEVTPGHFVRSWGAAGRERGAAELALPGS